MSDASAAVQAAVVVALQASSALSAAGWTVYDQPPSTASGRYVTVFRVINTPEVSDCFDGCDVEVILHLIDPNVGKARAQAAGAAVVAAIDAELEVEGFELHIHESLSQLYESDFETDVRGVIRQRYALQAVE